VIDAHKLGRHPAASVEIGDDVRRVGLRDAIARPASTNCPLVEPISMTPN
jgi:hypothetical protein